MAAVWALSSGAGMEVTEGDPANPMILLQRRESRNAYGNRVVLSGLVLMAVRNGVFALTKYDTVLY